MLGYSVPMEVIFRSKEMLYESRSYTESIY